MDVLDVFLKVYNAVGTARAPGLILNILDLYYNSNMLVSKKIVFW